MVDFKQKLINLLDTKTIVKIPLIGSQNFWDISKRKSDSLLLKSVNND